MKGRWFSLLPSFVLLRYQGGETTHAWANGERAEKDHEEIRQSFEHHRSIEFVLDGIGHVFLDRTREKNLRTFSLSLSEFSYSARTKHTASFRTLSPKMIA